MKQISDTEWHLTEQVLWKILPTLRYEALEKSQILYFYGYEKPYFGAYFGFFFLFLF